MKMVLTLNWRMHCLGDGLTTSRSIKYVRDVKSDAKTSQTLLNCQRKHKKIIQISYELIVSRWPRRGETNFTEFPAERCVRSAWEDRTIGFFCALFVRKNSERSFSGRFLKISSDDKMSVLLSLNFGSSTSQN